MNDGGEGTAGIDRTVGTLPGVDLAVLEAVAARSVAARSTCAATAGRSGTCPTAAGGSPRARAYVSGERLVGGTTARKPYPAATASRYEGGGGAGRGGGGPRIARRNALVGTLLSGSASGPPYSPCG